MLKRWNSLLLGALRHVPSIVSPCFVRVFVRYRSDLSASAVWCAHDRYCRGLGRALVLILHGSTELFIRGKDRGQQNKPRGTTLQVPLEQTYPNTGRAAA